jgi:hypothetical protein
MRTDVEELLTASGCALNAANYGKEDADRIQSELNRRDPQRWRIVLVDCRFHIDSKGPDASEDLVIQFDHNHARYVVDLAKERDVSLKYRLREKYRVEFV